MKHYTIDTYAVIGNPVSHSLSPLIHAEFAKQTRQRLEYIAIEAPLDSFARTVDEFRAKGGKGCNITLPFKGEAFELSQTQSKEAEVAQAVNTLVFEDDGSIFGANTDGIGLVRDISTNRHRKIAGQRILILGAGGAARGILWPLLNERPASITIANRTLPRAEALAEAIKLYGAIEVCDYPALQGRAFDLIINATSTSLSNQLPPMPDGIVAAGGWCYDLAYKKGERTVFQRWSAEQGVVESLDGIGMLVEQAAESFYLWRRVRPKTDTIIAHLQP